jgi:hypothetical protein
MGNELNRRDILNAIAGLGLAGAGDAHAASIDMRAANWVARASACRASASAGSHIGKPKLDEQSAIRIIRSALDCGMNFMDNSWD